VPPKPPHFFFFYLTFSNITHTLLMEKVGQGILNATTFPKRKSGSVQSLFFAEAKKKKRQKNKKLLTKEIL
jgi:hypothetical protein